MIEKRFRADNSSLMVRAFDVGRIIDAEQRTVEATLSTEYPVMRWDGEETLVHSPEAVDLSRAPLPLIVAHDSGSLPVGIVESLELSGTELKGILRFSKNQDEVWQDVQDGILRNLSVGYSVTKQDQPENGAYNVTRWMPYECSLVAAGADPTAQIHRDFNDGEQEKMDVNDLKKTRKKAMDDMKALAAQKTLTDENKTELRTLKSNVEDLNLRIEAFEMTDGDTGKGDSQQRCHLEVSEPSSRDFRTSDEYKKTYDKFLRFGRGAMLADEVRTLTIGSDPSMGFAVPESFETKLVKSLEDNNIMRSLCRVIKTSSDRKIPIVTGGTTAYWINEKGAYTQSDAELSQKTLGGHKLGVLCLASEELAHDLSFPLSSFLADDFGRAMGDKEEDSFVNGDGVEKPSGILLDAELGVTTDSSTDITIDVIIDLVHSLGRAYRKRASFLMSDATFKLIRKIQDGNGRYMLEDSLKVDAPPTIFGRPVHISDSVPAPTAGNKAILFGDYSYYWIADRQGRYFQELRELYAASGQIGYRANQRIDGKLILPEAVKYLQMKA